MTTSNLAALGDINTTMFFLDHNQHSGFEVFPLDALSEPWHQSCSPKSDQSEEQGSEVPISVLV